MMKGFEHVNSLPLLSHRCNSFVGKVGGKQGVSLQRSCIDDYGLILHEIGHALGFLHEHIRPDRDDYVDILHENINRYALPEFVKQDPSLVDTLGVGYDYNSVMHYAPSAFGVRSRTTIQAHDENIVVGHAKELSELDVIKVNILYGCTSKSSSSLGMPARMAFILIKAFCKTFYN